MANEFAAPEELRYRQYGVPCVVCGKRHNDGGIMLCAMDVCDGCYSAVARAADARVADDPHRWSWDRAFTAAKWEAAFAAWEERLGATDEMPDCFAASAIYRKGWQDAESRLSALEAVPARAELDAVRAFVERVNARAEARMQAGNPLEGSHYFSMQAELKAMEARAGADAGEEG